MSQKFSTFEASFDYMEIREKIIERAGELFVKNGIRQVTMDLIAQSLGVSKRTIYENFKDKNDLLRNFLMIAALRHKSEVLEIMKAAPNVIEGLFAFGEFNRKSFESISPLFFEDIKKYHPNIFKDIMQNDRIRNYDLSYTLLKRGVNEGIFVKSIDIELANLFIHKTMDIFHEMEREGSVDHKKFWQTVHLPYLKGICTEKGLDLLSTFINKNENLSHC